MRRFQMVALAAAAITGQAMSPATSSADAVFLVNGHVLHVERARVIGATVLLDFCGGKIRLPLARVEAIEPGPVPEQEQCMTGAPPEPVLGAREPVVAADEPAVSDSTETLEPTDTREYWRQRIDPIRERIAQIDERLERLPRFRDQDTRIRDTRIIVHGGNLRLAQERERYERIRATWEDLLRATLREARRAGVPPGWLRG